MTTYEHKISGDDPCVVLVRRKLRRTMRNHGRGLGWTEYMSCASPKRAAEILAMLRHGEPLACVTP